MKSNSDFFVENVSPELWPKSLIFLSADLVNSSSQKRTSRAYPRPRGYEGDQAAWEKKLSEDEMEYTLQKFLDDHWASYITEFYQKFQDIFRSELKLVLLADKNTNAVSEQSGKCGSLDQLGLEIWRLAGDEIIFTAEVTQPEQVHALCLAFVRSIIVYRKILYQESDFFLTEDGKQAKAHSQMFTALYGGCILDVKATIWWAGFPVSNREIVFSNELLEFEDALVSVDPRYRNYFMLYKAAEKKLRTTGTLVTDYVGPSIDIGFRLSELAKPNKAIVSVEVAYLLSICDKAWVKAVESALNIAPGPKKTMRIWLLERRSLRGVFGQKPYPIFALDSASNEGLSIVEEKMGGRGSLEPEEIEEYCNVLFRRNKRHINRPELIDMQSDFEEESVVCNVLERIDHYWRQEKQRIEGKIALGGLKS